MVEIVFARGLHELLLFDNSDLVALCFFLNLMFLLLVTKRKNRHIRKNTKVFSVMSLKIDYFPCEVSVPYIGLLLIIQNKLLNPQCIFNI